MPKPSLRVRLKTVAESVVRQGHPWVFDGSIRELNRPGETGELAVIYDRNDEFLAIGLFDAESPIRIRILHRGKPVKITEQWWEERLQAAIARREGLFENATNGYRIINGESDGWPGLVLDCYDEVFVVKLYTAAWLSRLGELTQVFRSKWLANTLVLRLSRNILSAARERGFEDGQKLSGPPFSNPVIFSENGIRFEADVIQGQKTGFFLDQSLNMQLVQQILRSRSMKSARILDLCCYVGHWSLQLASALIVIAPHARSVVSG